MINRYKDNPVCEDTSFLDFIFLSAVFRIWAKHYSIFSSFLRGDHSTVGINKTRVKVFVYDTAVPFIFLTLDLYFNKTYSPLCTIYTVDLYPQSTFQCGGI